jgi:hypothetical protein
VITCGKKYGSHLRPCCSNECFEIVTKQGFPTGKSYDCSPEGLYVVYQAEKVLGGKLALRTTSVAAVLAVIRACRGNCEVDLIEGSVPVLYDSEKTVK